MCDHSNHSAADRPHGRPAAADSEEPPVVCTCAKDTCAIPRPRRHSRPARCCCEDRCTCARLCSTPRHHQHARSACHSRPRHCDPSAGATEGRWTLSRRCPYCLPERAVFEEADLMERQQRCRSARAEQRRRYHSLQAQRHNEAACHRGAYRTNTADLLRASRGSEYQRIADAEHRSRREQLRAELAARRDELESLRRRNETLRSAAAASCHHHPTRTCSRGRGERRRHGSPPRSARHPPLPPPQDVCGGVPECRCCAPAPPLPLSGSSSSACSSACRRAPPRRGEGKMPPPPHRGSPRRGGPQRPPSPPRRCECPPPCHCPTDAPCKAPQPPCARAHSDRHGMPPPLPRPGTEAPPSPPGHSPRRSPSPPMCERRRTGGPYCGDTAKKSPPPSSRQPHPHAHGPRGDSACSRKRLCLSCGHPMTPSNAADVVAMLANKDFYKLSQCLSCGFVAGVPHRRRNADDAARQDGSSADRRARRTPSASGAPKPSGLAAPKYGRKVFITDDTYLERRASRLSAWEQAGAIHRIPASTRSPSAPLPEKTPKWRTIDSARSLNAESDVSAC